MNRSETTGRCRSEKWMACREERDVTDEQVTEARDHEPHATLDRGTQIYRAHAGEVGPNEEGTARAAPRPTNEHELSGWFSRSSTSEATLMTARRHGIVTVES